jgi:hypothetical protein
MMRLQRVQGAMGGPELELRLSGAGYLRPKRSTHSLKLTTWISFRAAVNPPVALLGITPSHSLIHPGLGTDPNNDPAEDSTYYFYFCVDDPSIRTPDIVMNYHYRGENPSAGELSAALGSDTLRAICWVESS